MSKTYHLNTSTVIIGRNNLSGIRVDDDGVMSHHVVLRRVPSAGSRDAFIMIARGGKVSLLRGGQWSEAKQMHRTLITGDVFQIGTTRFSYIMAYMSEEDYAKHFNAQPILSTDVPSKTLALQG
ncbi:MAG: FHA domain-containing protein [Cyanobacteria bacterium P01_F01_bin.42]